MKVCPPEQFSNVQVFVLSLLIRTVLSNRQGGRSKRWLLELSLCPYERTTRMPLVRSAIPLHADMSWKERSPSPLFILCPTMYFISISTLIAVTEKVCYSLRKIIPLPERNRFVPIFLTAWRLVFRLLWNEHLSCSKYF